jgi:hypothetical protein
MRRGAAIVVVGVLVSGLVATAALGAGKPNPVAGFKGSKTRLDSSFGSVNAALSSPAGLRRQALAGLHSKSGLVQFASVYALSLTAVRGSSLRALRPFVTSSSVDERMMAASSLVARGDRSGLPALVSALGSGAELGYLNEPVWQFARFVLLSFTSDDFGLRKAMTAAAARRTEAAWARAVRGGLGLRQPLTKGSSRKLSAAQTREAEGVGTQVDVVGDTATITVPVDVFGVGPSTFRDPDTGKLIPVSQWWQDGANAIWNKALAGFRYASSCGSYQLKVNLELFPISGDGEGTPGHHQVDFFADPNLVSEVFDPEDGGNHNNDDTGPYDQALTGQFGEIGQYTIAHETGHLMGLGDDYDDVYDADHNRVGSTTHPGRGDTIMRDHGSRTVDQALVDRLGRVLEQAGKLPSCWSGSIESNSQNVTVLSDGNTYQCSDHWHTDVLFTVQPGGMISGTGKATLVTGPSCSGSFDTGGFTSFPPAKEVDLSVVGSKQVGGFVLIFGYVSSDGQLYGGFGSLFTHQISLPGLPLTIPVTAPCVAAGTLPSSDSLEAGLIALTASNVFALKCANS